MTGDFIYSLCSQILWHSAVRALVVSFLFCLSSSARTLFTLGDFLFRLCAAFFTSSRRTGRSASASFSLVVLKEVSICLQLEVVQVFEIIHSEYSSALCEPLLSLMTEVF